MELLVHILVFVIVAFLFLHVKYQLKVSSYLEIYEIDYTTNDNLQTACDVRMPVVFDAPQNYHSAPLTAAEFSKHQLLADVRGFAATTTAATAANEKAISLQDAFAAAAAAADDDSRFYSMCNRDFLDETEIAETEYAKNDSFWRPSLTVLREYDYLFGANGATTPLQYHIDFRRFFHVSRGALKVKLAAWKNEKHLSPQTDYARLLFTSPVNPWTPQAEFEADAEKCKFVDIIVPAGKCIEIPPYCWYSFMFIDDDGGVGGAAAATTTTFAVAEMYSYKTIMNYVSTLPAMVMHHSAVTF